jgi:general secretion pathway protein G
MLNGKKSNIRHLGFTLIELLVVLSIIALLLTLATPRYFINIDRAKEATLKQDLNTVRDGIDKYFSDNGKYPDDLQEMVERRYINKMPLDPITESTETWLITPPEPPYEGNVYDIHSGSTAIAEDGSKFSNW